MNTILYRIIRPEGWLRRQLDLPLRRERRLTYDLWAVLLIGKVLALHCEFVDDERVENALYRAMKNLYDLMAEGKVYLFDWSKFRWFEGLVPLIHMYQRRPEDWMQSLGRMLREQGADYPSFKQLWERPVNQWRQETHIVNLCMMLKYEALCSAFFGEPFENHTAVLWHVLEKHNGTAVGTFTGDECLSGLANTQGTELCAVVELTVDADAGELSGWLNAHGDGTRRDFHSYVVMQFDQPIDAENTIGSNIAFRMGQGETLTVRLATSYVSVEQARLNLQREVGAKSYDTLKAETAAKWNDLLGKIVITDTEERKRTFYSCLYRCFLFPRLFHEYGADGQPVHYSTRSGEIVPGVMYTDNGFWDTCRTLYPLLTMLVPERVQEMVQGDLSFYREEGWLPKWLSPGERGIMPGTLVDAVLADAAVKGLLSLEQMELALEAMRHHANTPGDSHLHGRVGVEDYVRLGYVPCDKYRESANNTLDAAYCDRCISQVADRLGIIEIRDEYLRRSKNYRNLFDPAVGFIRGRNEDGTFPPDFSPVRWGGEYCEGAAWQNAFGVYHDVEGLAELYGGCSRLIAKLDELFATPPIYEVGTYNAEIHEMTEMAAADFGQCAISNQSSFHLPYLYAALGQPEKTAYWVTRIVNEAFSPDVYPGDEDNGSMAAWYVWSVLGMYPLCPGRDEFVQGACQVQRAEIHLPDGSVKIVTKEGDMSVPAHPMIH